MKFQAPSQSQEQVSLLRIAADTPGLDATAVKNLFWLIDAHPNLRNFVQIAENLLHILNTRPILALDVSARPWSKWIPAWRTFCRWLVEREDELKMDERLAMIFLRPQMKRGGESAGGRSHPLNDKGLSRHGVYAALWNRHESGSAQSTGGSRSEAYLGLQAQLLIALASARSRLTRIDDYLAYDQEKEFSSTPISSYPASLAVRDMSRSAWGPLLDMLDTKASVPLFCRALRT